MQRGGVVGFAVILCAGFVLLGATAALAEEIQITIVTQTVALEARTELMDWAIEKFKSLHRGVNVKWEPGLDVDKITTMMIAGVAPDIFEMWGDFAMNWAQSGMLLDLRPYVERDMDEIDLEDIFPGDWDACFIKFGEYEGEMFGFPQYTNAGITYYNVQEVANAGLPDIFELKDEWTFDKFREYARHLTYFDAQADRRRYGADTYFWGCERITGLVGSFGGRMVTFDPLAFVMDEPPAIQGLEFHRTLMHEDCVIPDRNRPWAARDFTAGNVPVLLEGSHAIPEIYPIIEFEWKTAPWPVGPGGRVSWAAGDKYGIFRGTQHPKMAWEFVKLLTSSEGSVMQARLGGLAPFRRSAMQEYIETYPEINPESHAITALTARVFEQSLVPESREFAATVNQALDRIWWEGVSAATAMKEIAGRIEKLFEPYK